LVDAERRHRRAFVIETARIRLDDALIGRLPPVCCMTGARADGYASLVVPKPLGVAWLLLLAGPLGVLVLIAIYPRIRTRYVVKLPLSAAAFERRLTLMRRRLWCGWLGVVGIAGGLALRWFGEIAAVLFVAGVVGVVAAVIAHLRLPWTMPSARADTTGRFVVLQGVHPRLAAAVAEE
jgi:hypothetical protein